MKKLLLIICSLALALGLGITTVQHKTDYRMHSKDVDNSATYEVVYVYDGDTIKLDNNQRVRLIGIDAPESHENPKLLRDVQKRQISGDKQMIMGMKAGKYVKSFLLGKRVTMAFDVDVHDRYGRLLAYVYLQDGTFVNQKIIQDGYAYPLTIPPNVRYAQQFQQWFNEARQHKRGLWQ